MREVTPHELRQPRCHALKASHADTTQSYCETENGQWVATVKKFIQNLDYGEVVLSVHAGRVVQVERTEKVRFS